MRRVDRVFGRLIAVVVRGLFATMRIRRLGRGRVDRLRAAGKPFVYAVLHGQQLLLLGAHTAEPCTVLVSRSRDGGRLAGLLEAFGLGLSRGSSSRGAVGGARDLRRALERGSPPVLAVDGPRGPAGSVAPGAARLAAAVGGVIVPVATASKGALRLSSWDRAAVPVPCSRQVVLYGRPICPGGDHANARIGEQLHRLTRRAEALCR